jgi:alkanesulfonate monooxygenase SsuD/methylene tetrahydromethanopterin reductase-like flavin-dependent oxidoreductase (luciferase family)
MASSMLLSFVQLRTGRPGRMPSPDVALAHEYTRDELATVEFYKRLVIVGTPEQCRARIEAVATRTKADEVMVATHAFDPAARIRSYELLGEAFGLGEAR